MSLLSTVDRASSTTKSTYSVFSYETLRLAQTGASLLIAVVSINGNVTFQVSTYSHQRWSRANAATNAVPYSPAASGSATFSARVITLVKISRRWAGRSRSADAPASARCRIPSRSPRIELSRRSDQRGDEDGYAGPEGEQCAEPTALSWWQLAG